MPQAAMYTLDASTIIWANRALIAGAVIYIYDWSLALSTETLLFSPRPRRALIAFIPLRYTSLLYQILVIVGIACSQFTPRSCTVYDNVSLSIDTVFQVSYVAFISRKVKILVTKRWITTLPLALFGFAAPLINIAAPNPSLFPQCRNINPSPSSRIGEIIINSCKNA
ncbi:hypothetical protein FB451DRAFT_1214441 [Mycena latifolia]|nr:hypothetical protein FB451DRAFT_1214441 [Mycena latifolia]